MNENEKSKKYDRYEKKFDKWYSRNIDSLLDIAMLNHIAPYVSDEFMASFDAAADRAHNLARLREKKTQIGFLPLTLAEYIHRLAEEIGLSPNLIPSLTGLPDLRKITLENVGALTEFAKNVGMTLGEILLYVRFEFMSLKGMGSSHLIFARQRGASPDMYAPDAIEKQLDMVEREYHPKDEAELFAVLDEISRCFGEEEWPGETASGVCS